MHLFVSRRRSPDPDPAVRSITGILIAFVLAAAPARAQVGEQQSTTSAGPGAGIVVGRIVDAATLAPIAGAQVRMSSLERSAVSGADGVFTLRGLPAADHTVMVSRVGYETLVSVWRVGEAGLELEVPLEAQPLVLEALQVQTSRFDRRMRSTGLSARGYTAGELQNSAQPDARAFVRSRMGAIATGCGALSRPGDGAQECVLVRGGPVRTCIIVDERPAYGGWSELELYRPQELFRVDVLGGGRVVQVYTAHYVAQKSRGSWRPTNADNLSMIACPRF